MTNKKAKIIAKVDGSLILLTIILGIVSAFTALPFWVPCITLTLSIAIDFLFLRGLNKMQKATIYVNDSNYEEEYDREEEAEQQRRDEKNGLYPSKWDDCN